MGPTCAGSHSYCYPSCGNCTGGCIGGIMGGSSGLMAPRQLLRLFPLQLPLDTQEVPEGGYWGRRRNIVELTTSRNFFCPHVPKSDLSTKACWEAPAKLWLTSTR